MWVNFTNSDPIRKIIVLCKDDRGAMAYGTVEPTADEQSQDNIQTTPEDQITPSDSHPTGDDEENPLLGPDETGQKLNNIASIIAVLLLGALCRSLIFV